MLNLLNNFCSITLYAGEAVERSWFRGPEFSQENGYA
ncbi:hypothetical protein MITS9509_01574 [Synechococcus sp. MIT S9509]|nr:hypothetical protein MITS9504_00526 [Synechococcus sp. MIT S9504]KZR92116.1 hypothetical protein MITS9509_01574 [Synechococcus sp. MIT S9509]